MPAQLAVVVKPLDGIKEYYFDAHIAGVWNGVLVVGRGAAEPNAFVHEVDAVREIRLADIDWVDIADMGDGSSILIAEED